MVVCQKVVDVDFGDILSRTPEGQIAMFKITAIPCSMSDHWCGSVVYVTRKGKFIDPMTDEKLYDEPSKILFLGYVKKASKS